MANEPRHRKAKVLTSTIRHLMVQPVIIVMAVATTVFTSVFSPDFYLGSEPFGLRLVLNSAYLVLYCAWTYLLLGRVLAAGLDRGLSWIVTQILFYLPMAAISTGAYFAVANETPTAITVPLVLVAIMAIVVVTVLLGVLTFRAPIDRLLDDIGHGGQTFRSRKAGAAQPREPVLAGVDEPILMLRGANQYVEVLTAEGQHLVRTRLRDAAARMPANAGFQINRSVWLAWSHIADVSQSGTRVVVTDKAGATHNVSPPRATEFQIAAALHRPG